MTDLTPNDLSPQGEHAPGPEPLSPAAQAVDHAIAARIYLLGEIAPSKQVAAAAIRVLADQIVPSKQNFEQASHEFATVFLSGVAYAANEMRLIATELENAQ